MDSAANSLEYLRNNWSSRLSERIDVILNELRGPDGFSLFSAVKRKDPGIIKDMESSIALQPADSQGGSYHHL